MTDDRTIHITPEEARAIAAAGPEHVWDVEPQGCAIIHTDQLPEMGIKVYIEPDGGFHLELDPEFAGHFAVFGSQIAVDR